ncbi:MAG: GNAT family N-acetyltransferase [Clostridiales bacterium]|jgi:GNAT superfamily N-acetyltransferase|nr:GNAT family N-acetyltransferase [Clostridiales bacterium]
MSVSGYHKSSILSRAARPSDIPSIMAIIRQAQASIKKLGIDQWQNGYPNEAVFLSDIEKKQCYVFHIKNEAAGVMVVSFEPEVCYGSISGQGWSSKTDKYGVIHRMAVSDKYKGGTLAKEMLSFAERLCMEKRVLFLRADTHRGNIPMQKYLSKNGFLYCGEVILDVEPGDPVRMGYEKVLKPYKSK